MMKHSVLILFLISFCWSSNVWAMMLPVKEPYKVVVGEGQYLFVMLPGYCVDEPRTLDMTDEEFAAFRKQQKERFRSLQRFWRLYVPSSEDVSHVASDLWSSDCVRLDLRGMSYGQSVPGKWEVQLPSHKWQTTESLETVTGQEFTFTGLYRNDGSSDPLWTVQWYAHQVYVSDDGRYLVRMGPWAAWLGELAVAFYENGRLLKAYVIAELFSDISDLSPPVSGYILANLESSYDPSSNRLTIETTSNDIHTFDVTTGKIVSSKKIRSLEIDAEVLMRDGRQIPVTNFRHCGSYLGTKARLEDGVTEVQALVVYRDTEAYGGDSGVAEKVTFPLNQLSDLLNIGPVEGVDHQHSLTFTSGERATVRLSDAFGPLCGDNESGEGIEFPLDAIEAVYFGE